MLMCSFELNNRPMSVFKIGASSYPAFSGLSPHINDRLATCLSGHGPIPTRKYYILDRESGGRLGWLYDLFKKNVGDWFSLYADDGKVDDETFCNQMKRAQFRLHPKGNLGISEGCIVINQATDFYASHSRKLLVGLRDGDCHMKKPRKATILIAWLLGATIAVTR
ncbi:DUF2778 domain-containing protein [Dyella sp.]|uniref:DUF2778 domain-containing protein n=1 Tax=Dyella sp. TaxID=1869338 RepID=UPI002B49ADF2|nr:DUF2778 domain-containing protein [Dyella sp.]HKT30597.1 DUF2778 domain-containing protein [Dyella sp.]